MTTRAKGRSALAAQLRDSAKPMLRHDILKRFGKNALDACLADSTLARVLPGVYAHRQHAQTRATRVYAASLWAATAEGVLTSDAALWLWGVLAKPPSKVTVLVRHPLHRAPPPWLNTYRPRAEVPTVRVKGVAVVALAHAVVHAWIQASGTRGTAVVIETIGRGHVRAAEVEQAAALTGRVHHRKRLLALLALLADGVTSYLEHYARTRVFTKAEFPELQWQYAIRVAGRMRMLDAFDPVSRVALEFDSIEFHDESSDRLNDIERDAEFAGEGILTLRLDSSRILKHPDWCKSMYRRARAARLHSSPEVVKGA